MLFYTNNMVFRADFYLKYVKCYKSFDSYKSRGDSRIARIIIPEDIIKGDS